jgi:hypothetical protein
VVEPIVLVKVEPPEVMTETMAEVVTATDDLEADPEPAPAPAYQWLVNKVRVLC